MKAPQASTEEEMKIIPLEEDIQSSCEETTRDEMLDDFYFGDFEVIVKK